jgi:hypothetical protein
MVLEGLLNVSVTCTSLKRTVLVMAPIVTKLRERLLFVLMITTFIVGNGLIFKFIMSVVQMDCTYTQYPI